MTDSRLPNTLLLRLIALLSALAITSAGAGVIASAQAGAWLPVSLHGVILLAGILGVLMGFRRFLGAPALAASCIGGTIFTAGFLAFLSATGDRDFLTGDFSSFESNNINYWLFFAELAAAGVVGAVAGLLALGRSPGESWKQLALGVALGAPVVVGGAAAYKLHLAQRIGSMNMIVATLVSVALFVVVVGLLSASANAIIKAFAAGLPDLDDLSVDPEAPVHAKPKANKATPPTGAGSAAG